MKNFEQYIRDRFDGREVQVDKNELWANIAPQLESPKKERKIWFFFLLGITTGATMLGLYFLTQQDSATSASAITNTAIAEQQVAVATSNLEQTQSTNQKATPEVILANLSGSQAGNSTTTKQLSATSEPPKTNPIQPNQSIRKYARPCVSTNLVSTNPVSTNPVSTNPVSTNLVSTNQSINQTHTQNPIPPTGWDETATSPAQTKITEANLPLSDIATLLIPSLDFNPFTNSFSNTKKLAEKTPSDLISPQPSKNRMGLGLYGGMSATQTLHKERVSSDFIYAQLRGSTEDPLPAIHLGIQAVFEIKQNIYIQTGLEYSQLRSRLNLEDEVILVNPITNEITRDFGITDIPVGATAVEVQQNKTLNQFHLVDLPVLAGYQFGQTRWRVGLEAGAFINLSLQRDGEILQQDVSVYDLKEDSDGWYKGNVGIRPHLGLVSTYNLTQHYQLYFSTGMTFNKVFTTDRSPLQEEKSLFGVRMGGRYFF